MATPTQNIVSARLMSELAINFNIGADIFGKGNRHVESQLGAEKMSGDTVMVPIYDGGSVYHDLDISNEDLSVKRDAVPVRVGSFTTACELSQEDLTLAAKEPEFLAKRVANLALDVQTQSVECLEANALSATVISRADIDNGSGTGNSFAARNKIYDLVAGCEASKFDGKTNGVIHPMVYSKLLATFQGQYAPNDKRGNGLYENELGPLAGIDWSKTQLLKTIKGVATITGDTTIAFDFSAAMAMYYASTSPRIINAPMAVPSVIPYGTVSNITVANYFPATGNKVGDLSQPFYLKDSNNEYVQTTDVLGNPTGRNAVFQLRASAVSGGAVTAAVLAAPVFFEGARQNVFHSAYAKYDPSTASGGTITALESEAVLTAGKLYLPPAIVWKQDDFLVAAKGLAPFVGSDSLTIPTRFKDKGYLPLRGWCFTLPLKATTVFRVDVLAGMAAYTRTSMNSLYIEA